MHALSGKLPEKKALPACRRTAPIQRLSPILLNRSSIKEEGLAERFAAVGHRIVHGGEKFTQSVLIDEEVLEGIEECASLAPLHNPAHILGIKAAQAAFPSLPQVAVFDTAFHQTMPAKAFMYALPYNLYKEKHVRRYGMHGTSHLFVTHEAAKALNKPVSDINIISAHLGNGASVSAIKKWSMRRYQHGHDTTCRPGNGHALR